VGCTLAANVVLRACAVDSGFVCKLLRVSSRRWGSTNIQSSTMDFVFESREWSKLQICTNYARRGRGRSCRSKRPVTYVRAPADLHFRHSHTNTLHLIFIIVIQSASMSYNYRCLVCARKSMPFQLLQHLHAAQQTLSPPHLEVKHLDRDFHHSETFSPCQQHGQILTW
jgi:hypothetical protein